MRYSLLGVNIILLVAVVTFIISQHSGQAVDKVAISTASSSAASQANPLDQLSAADIAESIAAVANLPEATAVRNQADSVNAELAITPAEDVIASKPQVLATAIKSREDIQNYVVQPGDTVASLATKFNVTSNSIEWSNNLSGNTLKPGTKLVIPPVTGIVYTVKAGDTPQSLAQKYAANAAQIIAFNDAELSGLTPGEQIVIPSGQVQAVSSYSPFSAYGFSPSYGSNGYDYGFCTWYVASQISVPSNWGNAATWAYYARLSGWSVSQAPSVGAIAQTAAAAGGEGHVAIVRAVNGNQVLIQDMNGIAGWGRVGEAWEPISEYQNFITH